MIDKQFFDSLTRKQKSKLTVLIMEPDRDGNRYVVDSQGQRVYMKKNDRRINIGYIGMQRGKLVYLKHVKEERHLYRNTDAWGINTKVLKHVEGVQVIADESISYKILAEDAYKHGEYMNFKNSDAELQLFVPRKFWYKEN